jgi:ATP-dependent exoDNAse (exonuclease V) beta subunit
MQDFVPIDAAARRAAVQVLDRPLLVEAGAGTGKTSLLVAHVAHALAVGAAAIDRVVAITFTEKAAAELRLRLRVALEKQLQDPEVADPARARLAAALHGLDRARVATIHAWAAEMLREHPVQARLDPEFRILDELESAQLFGAFWQRWTAARLDDASAERLREAFLAGVRLEPDLLDLARALYEQRDVAQNLRLPRPPARLADDIEAWCAGARRCIEHAAAHCHDPGDGGLAALRRLGSEIDALAALPEASRPGAYLRGLEVRVRAGRQDAWDPGEARRNKELRARLRADQVALRQRIADRLLHGVLGWLAEFRRAYAVAKHRRAGLDFQDLLLEARRLVSEDTAVRRALASRIDLLCVDEFQDTDPLQAELVMLLAEVGGPAVSLHDVRVGAKLFLVGDPKQSIYRFRRADLDVYERCAEIVVASGGSRLDIVQSFRSRPAVLQWVNGTFAPLFAAGADAGAPRYVALAPRPDSVPVPAVWILRGPAPEGRSADAMRRAEATAQVAWLARALAEGWPVRDGDGTRALRPGDVAFLFPRTAGIEHYETALRTAGLPFQQEGGKLFFHRQEVRDVLHALAAIDDPEDELSIVAMLRSALCGVTDEDLWLHRSRSGGFRYLEPAPQGSPLAAHLGLLAELHRERHERGVAGTIARLLDRTGARAVLAARPQGAQALANLGTLERLARRFETTPGAGLREFVRSLGDVDPEAPRLAEWSPQDELGERVRLLTVHAAKGLEFPCVLLANLSARAATRPEAVAIDRRADRVEVRLGVGDGAGPLATAGYAALAARERERDAAEERRLLYVAATRARDYLVVGDSGADAGLLRALRQVPASLGAGRCGELPAPARPGAGVPQDASWCVLESDDLPPAARRRVPAAVADLRDLWGRREAWAAAHARRLARGSAVTAGAAPTPAAQRRGWHRDSLAAAELDTLVRASRRVARGVPIGAALGQEWIGFELALALETGDGWVLVQEQAEWEAAAVEHALGSLAALAEGVERTAGRRIIEVGILCRSRDVYVRARRVEADAPGDASPPVRR